MAVLVGMHLSETVDDVGSRTIFPTKLVKNFNVRD